MLTARMSGGLTSSLILERTREIGVLKAMGASRTQVFGLVMAEAGLTAEEFRRLL